MILAKDELEADFHHCMFYKGENRINEAKCYISIFFI